MDTETHKQIEFISSFVDESKRLKILFCLPESAGDIFLSTSLLECLSSLYTDCAIYYACKPEYMDILKNNPFIYKIIPYVPVMEKQVIMEGTGEWRGLFDISILPGILTQRCLNYLNNGIGKVAFKLKNY